MKGLSPAQERVLEFIVRHVDEHGSPPTMREIARSVGSKYTNTGATYVEALVAKGMVVKRDGVARGILITPAGRRYSADLGARGQLG